MNTPLTDAFMVAAEKTHYPPHPYPIADFARKLERDRAKLIEALNDVLDSLGAKNKPWGLEEYGFSPKHAEKIVCLTDDLEANK